MKTKLSLCLALLLIGNLKAEVSLPELPLQNLHEPNIGSLEMETLDIVENDTFDTLKRIFGLSPSDISTIIDLTELGIGLIEAIPKLFNTHFNISLFDAIELPPRGDKKLLGMFETISHRLNEIQAGVEGTQASLRLMVRSLPNVVRWEVALATLSEYAMPINNLYHSFNFYQIHRDSIEEHTLMDFSRSVISHDTTSIMALMGSIHSMIAPHDPPIVKHFKTFEREEYLYDSDIKVKDDFSRNLRSVVTHRFGDENHEHAMSNLYLRPGLFDMLMDAMKFYDFCSMDQSSQGLVMGLYSLIGLTQARGYTMMNFAWLYLRSKGEGKFSAEQRLTVELYEHYSKALHREVIKALASVSNSYHKCNPRVQKEGETYVKMNELLQGYLENEVDMNESGTCQSKCSDYKHTESKGCFHKETQYCGKHRRCRGTIHDCQFMDSDAWVCISPDKHRRYDWIKYENLMVMGKEDSCENIMKVDSWWRFLVHCSYCLCLCDDPKSPTSDRFISMLPVVSDISENRIITGVRFTKKNRVIHLQVQEGKALAQGQVDPKTRRWREVEPISVDSGAYVPGEHFATLKYEKRNIDFDLLKAPRGHVITGLKFRMFGSHLNLEIWVTPINFTTGILSKELSYWISNDNTPVMKQYPRKELEVKGKTDPTKTPGLFNVNSKNNTYLSFGPTDMYIDVGQLTVPFFDAQDVAPQPGTWLQGVEIHHRGSGNAKGFIGITLHSYNLTSHFQANIF